MAGDNPYLAHLPPHLRGSGSSSPKPTTKEHPLHGFLPRKVTASQVAKALVRPPLQWRIAQLTVWCKGKRHQPIYQPTLQCAIQEDSGGPQKVTRLCSDGRVLQTGKSDTIICRKTSQALEPELHRPFRRAVCSSIE